MGMVKGISDYILGKDLYHILDTKKYLKVLEKLPLVEAYSLRVLSSWCVYLWEKYNKTLKLFPFSNNLCLDISVINLNPLDWFKLV